MDELLPRGFCPSCRAERELMEVEILRMPTAGGVQDLQKGLCSVCGGTVVKVLAKPQDPSV